MNRSLKYDAGAKKLRLCHGKVARQGSTHVWIRDPRWVESVGKGQVGIQRFYRKNLREKEPLVGLVLWQKALNSFQWSREDHKQFLLSIVAFVPLTLNKYFFLILEAIEATW